MKEDLPQLVLHETRLREIALCEARNFLQGKELDPALVLGTAQAFYDFMNHTTSTK